MMRSWKSFSLRALLAVALVGTFTSCGQKPLPLNVLLITFDTTRADFIGAYGREDATTPTLDGMAANGFLFEHARSSNPITQPAHSTILSGVYPLMHGVRDNGMFTLPDEVDTLAELLKAQGYATGAAIGGFPLTRDFGADQGFDFYDDDLRAPSQDHRGRPAQRRYNTWYDERPAAHVNDAILEFLRAPRDGAFFAWIHYWDPHEPHIAPPPFGQTYAHDPYQGEIAYADNNLGILLDKLDEMGELDRTIIVMTSDHGEGRGEHDEATHAFLAYETTLRVPLIMQVPGMAGGLNIKDNVGTVDIVPTVLDILGYPIPEAVQGRSLVGLMEGQGAALASEPYYAESISPRLSHGHGDLRVLYDGPLKYIHGPRPELFDISSDPRELAELAADQPEDVDRLRDRLETLIGWYAGNIAAKQDFDEERIQRLAGLGYLNLTGGEVSVSEELRTDGDPPQDHVEDINKVFQLRRLMGSGAFRQAIRISEAMLEKDPDSGYLQAQLAMAYVGVNDIGKALSVVREHPATAANIDAFSQVLLAWAQEGDSTEAAELLENRLETQASARALLMLAEIYRLSENEAAVTDALARAVEHKPDDRVARLELALAQLEQGALDEAEANLSTLLESGPADARAHYGLSRVYWNSELPEEALERLSRAILLDPMNCDALDTRVAWLSDLGREDDAADAASDMPRFCQNRQTLNWTKDR